MKQVRMNLLSPDVLLQQLVSIEDHRYRWLDEQIPLPSRERDELNELLDSYIDTLLTLIKESRRSMIFDNLLPLVIMNSKVEVELLPQKQCRLYRILPFYEEKVRPEDISILSPMGRSLLLQTNGALVRVPAPVGELTYQIRSISLYQSG